MCLVYPPGLYLLKMALETVSAETNPVTGCVKYLEAPIQCENMNLISVNFKYICYLYSSEMDP